MNANITIKKACHGSAPQPEGAMSLTWFMLSRHARLAREMRHDDSKAAGIHPALHAWLARNFNQWVLIADGAC